jgi:hypothetical protein
MGSKRTPINRETRRQIMPVAIEAFKRMEQLRTQCGCLLMKHGWRCSACDEWWKQHSILHDEVGAKPWEWPAFLDPDDTNPYPPVSQAAREWEKERAQRPEAFELFELLWEASQPKSRKSIR